MKSDNSSALTPAAMKMNIRALASALHLSPGTVSRSLRHHPDIASTTRDLVIRTAAEMGYTPRAWTPRRGTSGAASRAATPSSFRTLGMLVGDGYGLRPDGLERSFFAHYFLGGIHAAAQPADITTSTAFIEKADLSSLQDPAHYPALLRRGNLDGLILIYPFPEKVVEKLASRWPCVSIERHDTLGLLDSVGHAQTPAICESVAHLHRLGHRRLGFVADIHATGDRTQLNERFAGFLTGLGRFGLDYEAESVMGMLGTNLTDDALVHEVAKCIKGGVTGWVCALDRQAYLLSHGLPRHGLTVPNDASVVGFGGIVPLLGMGQATTWRVPYEIIGAAALDAVLSRARHGELPICHREFPCEFVQGTTTAPAAKA